MIPKVANFKEEEKDKTEFSNMYVGSCRVLDQGHLDELKEVWALLLPQIEIINIAHKSLPIIFGS